MKNKILSLITGGALAALLTGCGTMPPPTKWYVRRGPTYNQTMPTVDRVGVVVDAAIAYDRVDTNYFVIEDSLLAISNLIREATANLKAKGYEIAFVESPFVGAFKYLPVDYAVADKRKDTPAIRKSPFHTAGDAAADAAYREALARMARDIAAAIDDRGELPTEHVRADEATRAALKAVAEKRGIRYLLLVHGNGTIVSGGKQTGQAIGTALLTGVITLGNVVVVAHNISTLDSYVSLLDLQNAEVLWSNSLALPGLNPANAAHYKERWAHNVLYWLPPRGQLEPPSPK